ncbi:MAG: acetoacetyl-CoA reductase [Candidatus Midichloriaceae bacterium]|jgi:acetoacetyl-CoA reductase|nr:acetoacetyl-CoA reductase [Candidatus Midichloriaceae bacterium]
MTGRRAVVTGGTRGIGGAISQALKKAGYNVVAIYAGNEQAARDFEAKTGIKALKCDVSNYKQCVEDMKEIEKALGGNVEVLVNNAGITRDGMMHKMPQENWYDVINTNLNSVFNMTRCVIESMRENKFGRIISMSSVNANGQMGQTNYAAAKAGIEGFTKSLALESAKSGITVNAIAPGYINTEMVGAMPQEVLDKIVARVPVGRLGETSEIARTVLFLADENAGFVTGAVFSVNGGLRT